jgi:HD-GYP domain-containing protein (c-di-GMP phosphodiesterase class II)
MHHERCDGSGYPLGLGEDRINKYAKIVAIADVYDAMTAARIYRGPLCPFKVISIFETEGLQKYDGKYILTFLEHIATTYMNNRVRLSNGKEGEVVFMNRNSLSKPMIKCGKTFIDLSKEPDIYIETFV